MRSASLATLLLILLSAQALALCAGQSPGQKVIFEDRFADNAAGWFLNDRSNAHGWILNARDDMTPTVGNGMMTIEALLAWAVPERQMVDTVSRAADICVRFSWPATSSDPIDVPEVGIITYAVFRSDRLQFAYVHAVDKNGSLKQYSLPLDDDYGPAYSPIVLTQFPEAGSAEVVELRVVTTLAPSDDASKPGKAMQKYFINGKEIGQGEEFVDKPNSEKQSYGIFVTNVAFATDQARIGGSFPIRYFNVLSPD